MDFDVAHWTILACLEVLHDTTFTDCRWGKKELNMSLFLYFTLGKHENRSSLCLRLKLTGVQTLCNCCGVYEVTCAKVADDVFVQVLDLQLDLLLLGHTKLCLIKPLRIHFCSYNCVDEKPLPGLTIGLNRI